MINKNKLGLLFNASVVTTGVSTALLCISFIRSFDAQSGYFTEGIFPLAFNIFFVIQIVLALASFFALPRKAILATPDDASKRASLFALVGVTLVLFSTLGLVLNIQSSGTIDVISCIGSCGFGSYLLIIALKRSFELKTAKLVFLYSSILFPISSYMMNNSNYARHINSVENTLTIVFLVSFLLYLIYEGRRIVTGTHARLHFPVMLLTGSVGITLSVAYTIAYIADAVHEEYRLFDMLLILLICIYILIEAMRFFVEGRAHSKLEWEMMREPQVEPEQGGEIASNEINAEIESVTNADTTAETDTDVEDSAAEDGAAEKI